MLTKITVLSLLGLCAVRTPALAEPALSIAEKEARELFQRGSAALSGKDYQEAASDFKEAYKLVPEPLFLYNLGQAHRLAHEKIKAVYYYREFIRVTNGDQRLMKVHAVAVQKAEELERSIDAERRIGGEPSGPEQLPRPPSQAPADASAVTVEAPKAPTLSLGPGASATQSPSRWFRNGAGWAALGSGIALAVVGAGLAGSAPGVNDQAGSRGTLQRYNDLRNEASALNVAGWTCIGVGAAIAVAGAIVLAIPRHKSVTLAFASRGVSLRGTW